MEEDKEYTYRLNDAKYKVSQNLGISEDEVSQENIIKFLIEKIGNLKRAAVLQEDYNQKIIYSLTKDKYTLLDFIDKLSNNIESEVKKLKVTFPDELEMPCIVEHIDENGNKELISSCDIEEQKKINEKIYPELTHDLKYPHD